MRVRLFLLLLIVLSATANSQSTEGDIEKVRELNSILQNPLRTASSNDLNMIQERFGLLNNIIEDDSVAAAELFLPADVLNKMPDSHRQFIESEIDTTSVLTAIISDFPDENTALVSYQMTKANEAYNIYKGQPDIELIHGAQLQLSGHVLGEKFVVGSMVVTNEVVPQIEPTGPQFVFIFRAGFSSEPDILNPPTNQEIIDMVFTEELRSFYNEVSYGKISWEPVVGGFYSFERSFQHPNRMLGCLVNENEAIEAATALGFNINDFDRVIVLQEMCPAGQLSGRAAGVSTVGPASGQRWSLTWFPLGATFRVTSHELGHSLGFFHANGLWCTPYSVGRFCTGQEYENDFDVMGNGFTPNAKHFNAAIKDSFGWFDQSERLVISESGTYTINPLISGSPTKMALISTVSEFDYYLEYRIPEGFDSILSDSPQGRAQLSGLIVNRINKQSRSRGSELVDMTPSELQHAKTVTLHTDEREIYDQENGIVIGPVIIADDKGITFQVQINEPQPQTPEVRQIKPYGTVGFNGNLIPLELRTIRDSYECRYSKSADRSFYRMANRFELVRGFIGFYYSTRFLAEDGENKLYVRCREEQGTVHEQDIILNFTLKKTSSIVYPEPIIANQGDTMRFTIITNITPLSSIGRIMRRNADNILGELGLGCTNCVSQITVDHNLNMGDRQSYLLNVFPVFQGDIAHFFDVKSEIPQSFEEGNNEWDENQILFCDQNSINCQASANRVLAQSNRKFHESFVQEIVLKDNSGGSAIWLEKFFPSERDDKDLFLSYFLKSLTTSNMEAIGYIGTSRPETIGDFSKLGLVIEDKWTQFSHEAKQVHVENGYWVALGIMSENPGEQHAVIDYVDVFNQTSMNTNLRIEPIGDRNFIAGRKNHIRMGASWAASPVAEISVEGLPHGAEFEQNNEQSGHLSWNPNDEQLGTHTVTFIATNGLEESRETIDIEVKPEPHILVTSPSEEEIVVGIPLTISWFSNAVDLVSLFMVQDGFTFPLQFNLENTGTMEWIPIDFGRSGPGHIRVESSTDPKVFNVSTNFLLVEEKTDIIAPSSVTLVSNTESFALSISTNEPASCKYSSTANTQFNDMQSTFNSVSGKEHISIISDASLGLHKYFAKCKDAAGNQNLEDYMISLVVGEITSESELK